MARVFQLRLAFQLELPFDEPRPLCPASGPAKAGDPPLIPAQIEALGGPSSVGDGLPGRAAGSSARG